MLTQQQRDAMTRAQAGDFRLADAMELLAPERQQHCGYDLLGGIPQGGRLQLLVYGDRCECEECDDGEVECEACGHVSVCETCGGKATGTITDLHQDGWAVVVNLNGDVVYRAEQFDPTDTPPLEVSLTRRWAENIAADYHKEQQDKARAAASSTQPALVTEGALVA